MHPQSADFGFLSFGLVLLAACVISVPIARRLRISAIVAYLFAGAVIGPWGFGVISAPTAMLAVAGLAVAAWGLALPGPAWVWGLAIAGTGIATGLFYPRFFAAMTTAAPPELRARVLASVTIAISAPGPLGFLAAGLVSEHSTFASRVLVGGTATVAAVISWATWLRASPAPNATPS